MANDQAIREKVRALVRDFLANTPNAETNAPSAKIIDVVKPHISEVKEFDRDESAKDLITADDLRGLETGAKLRVAENAKFTPSARDLIREKGIELVKKSERHGSSKIKSIAIGGDHGGFEFKEKLKTLLAEKGFRVRDFGTNSKDAVDYPDFAYAVAVAVSNKNCDVGIIIDGAGIGSAMTANKVPHIRAAACYSVALAKNSREHNGANVLTLGSGQNTFAEIVEIVEAWLSTELTEARHAKRVAKIINIEKQHQK